MKRFFIQGFACNAIQAGDSLDALPSVSSEDHESGQFPLAVTARQRMREP